MAVTPVGQNRPQPQPAPAEVPQSAAQKSGGGGTVDASGAASARAYVAPQQDQVQARTQAAQSPFAQDVFDPGATNQAQATNGADSAQDNDPFAQALSSLVQALHSVVDLVKNILPPEDAQALDAAMAPLDAATQNADPVGQNTDQAVAQDPNAPITRDQLDALGGGPGVAPGDPTDPTRTPFGLGPLGPGAQGTQPGAYGVAGINQNDPNMDGDNADYKFGQTNCAPTAMAEIARGKSLEDPNYSLTYNDANGVQQTTRVADMTNEQLVSVLGELGKTNKDGTSPNGVIDMASAMGLPVTDGEVQYDKNFDPNSGQPSHSFDQQWLDDKLANGEKVVVNGAYQATDDQGNTGLVGHFMTIAGKNADGTYKIMDPWDGKQKDLTGDQVRRFMQANQTNGGVMLAVGHSQQERAAEAQKAAETQQAAQPPVEQAQPPVDQAQQVAVQ